MRHLRGILLGVGLGLLLAAMTCHDAHAVGSHDRKLPNGKTVTCWCWYCLMYHVA